MTKALVNGVECVIYSYRKIDGRMICDCKFKAFPVLVPVLAELIEVVK